MQRTALALLVAASGAFAVTADAATSPPIDQSATVVAQAVRVDGPEQPEEPDEPDRALLVSDSAWLGMQFYSGVDQVQGFEHTLSLKSCRRRVTTSCENFDGFVPITLAEEIEAKGDGYTTLIVATGYNDSDQRFVDDIDDIVSLARSYDYERIVWLTLRSNVSYTSPGNAGFAEVFENNNATLQQVVDDATFPEIVIADWADYADDEPGWFADDGIHLRNLGGYAAGDYISRKMAFLDARACPQPVSAGSAPLDPCPDPDADGTAIDLASIYPVGQRDPASVFTLSFEGSSSWPGAPWWE